MSSSGKALNEGGGGGSGDGKSGGGSSKKASSGSGKSGKEVAKKKDEVVFSVMEKVPASRPHIEGLEEKYVKKLLNRNDAGLPLSRMLDEEAMTVSDLLKRRKRELLDGGDFRWAPDMRLRRFQLMVQKLPVGEDMYEEHERTVDPPGSLAERLKKVKPLPRSEHVCSWTGHDAEENIYVCNGRVILNANGESGRFCGYHTRSCVGPHAVPVHVVSPNEKGLCFACYALQHAGKTPQPFENELLVPNIAYGAPANRHNPLAPPLYRTKSRVREADPTLTDRAGADAATPALAAGVTAAPSVSATPASSPTPVDSSSRFVKGKYLERYTKLAKESRSKAIRGHALSRRELFALAMVECVPPPHPPPPFLSRSRIKLTRMPPS